MTERTCEILNYPQRKQQQKKKKQEQRKADLPNPSRGGSLPIAELCAERMLHFPAIYFLSRSSSVGFCCCVKQRMGCRL